MRFDLTRREFLKGIGSTVSIPFNRRLTLKSCLVGIIGAGLAGLAADQYMSYAGNGVHSERGEAHPPVPQFSTANAKRNRERVSSFAEMSSVP
jgi:hypothetical protein